MGTAYRAVGWNRQKRIYDGVLALGVVLYLVLFVGLGAIVHPESTAETLLIRGLGTAAFLLLHVILSIGPLARLDARFLPLLYNRRHMGVVVFLLAAGHGLFSLVQFHALGDVDPLVSVLTSNPRVDSVAQFPFQPLGLAALGILFLMAATSHDFWLANLTAPVWKALHMLVYVAWALLVAHVVLGVLQAETNPVFAVLVAAGAVWLVALHLVAGLREAPADRPVDDARVQLATEEGPAGTVGAWVPVCRVDEIPEGRARVVTAAGDRVAVFKYDGKVAALSNACQHQNGPLGEGCVKDGKVVCPWHGYEYLPDCGRSPEPFAERVPTFRVTIENGVVLLDPRPLPAGTPVEPARTEEVGS
jgi:nitrite reductase/ring-hydroxylating ferredoxin subunit/DMSO/TMAO reductase YedYZ heme-binding membrane subunit